MEDIEIPIDKQLQEFKQHVLANPRTFLSSKFGDGKSYFLNEFKKQNEVDSLFVTIFPVNYQIATNEDIFNLIKRDVLFQLIVQGLFEDGMPISNELALWGYIQNNYKSLLVDLLPSIASVALPGIDVSKVINLFRKHKKSFDQYKQGLDKDGIIMKFLESADKNFVYEDDIITEIIKQAILKFKGQNTKKKIVLIIEDLDRLDPAHLFRILNIFSAHIDFCYKNMSKPDSTLKGNKFGFDNVVFVADFSNIRKIFKHFYGEQTDFKGYIGKFLSSSPYEYSIRKIRNDYIYDYISKIINCSRQFLEKVLTEEMLENKTTRECIQAFDIDSQIKEVPKFRHGVNEVVLDKTFLKILAVLHRLKIANEDILRTCMGLFYADETNFCKYVAPYFLLLNNNEANLIVEIKTRFKDSGSQVLNVHIDAHTGLGGAVEKFDYYNDMVLTDFSKLYTCILDYIVK